MNDLLSRLRSAGLIIPKEKLKPTTNNHKQLFEEYYDGFWQSNNAGKVFFMQETIPYGSKFGLLNFSNHFSPKGIINISGINEQKEISLEQVVFLDIETTSLSIGAGSFAFLIGLCHFSTNGIQTNLLFIESPNDEPALLLFLDEEISKFKVISSYNGKSFDIPLLKNRYIMNRMKPEFLDQTHIDLLHLSRKIWKSRINNCRLSDIEREILLFKRTDKEIPGWIIPQLYFDFLDEKSPQVLEGVFYHNQVDVLSLAALFQYIDAIIENPSNIQNLHGIDLVSLARIYQQLGQRDFSAAFYDEGLRKGIDHSKKAIVFRNLGFLYKKQGELDKAIGHWKIASNHGDFISCIELAKYYEHTKRKIDQALFWTKNALQSYERVHGTIIENSYKREIMHRLNRLNKKVEYFE